MKKEQKVEYKDCVVTCACGETFATKSTKKEINEFLKQVEYYNKYEENIFFIK